MAYLTVEKVESVILYSVLRSITSAIKKIEIHVEGISVDT